jgi:hypothetical protein
MSLRNSIHKLKIDIKIGNVFAKFWSKNNSNWLHIFTTTRQLTKRSCYQSAYSNYSFFLSFFLFFSFFFFFFFFFFAATCCWKEPQLSMIFSGFLIKIRCDQYLSLSRSAGLRPCFATGFWLFSSIFYGFLISIYFMFYVWISLMNWHGLTNYVLRYISRRMSSLFYECRCWGQLNKIDYQLFRWLYMCVTDILLLLLLIMMRVWCVDRSMSTFKSRSKVIGYIWFQKTIKNATKKTREAGRLILNRWKMTHFLWDSSFGWFWLQYIVYT